MSTSKKLYCYVDESGQDTKGKLFVVSVIVTGNERDQLIELCEKIEQTSGKGRFKWNKTRPKRRAAYFRKILNQSIFKGKLKYAVYQNTKDYLFLTVRTVALGIQNQLFQPDKIVILIDALQPIHVREVGKCLRRFGIQNKKVRGVKKEENNALIRLADALCGFVRLALEGEKEMKELFEEGKANGFITELE